MSSFFNTVNWFHVLLFDTNSSKKWFPNIAINTNYSSLHYSFVSTQLNGSKYCYVSLMSRGVPLRR